METAAGGRGCVAMGIGIPLLVALGGEGGSERREGVRGGGKLAALVGEGGGATRGSSVGLSYG